MLTSYWVVLALAGAALSAPAPAPAPGPAALRPRATVDHDSLNPIATRVQSGAKGAAIEKFNPKLHIASGCQPYTAVDDAGNVG